MTTKVRSTNDFLLDISQGRAGEYSVVHKFGRNMDVGTSFEPICNSGLYRTPQSGSATQLRVKAGNAADASGGAGARAITLVGIDANGDEITETIATNGESAGTASTNSFMRLYRAFVSSSGTYAAQSAGSHVGAITIENSAGTEDWLTISATGFPAGQSEVGAYTVPNGYKAYIKNIFLFVDSSKPATLLLFQRQNILETAAPYSSMRVVFEVDSAGGGISVPRDVPLGPFPANTDIGFMGKVATTAATVTVSFDIILVQE